MSLQTYERNLKYARTIMIAGIPMLFEKVEYAISVGIFMIIFGAFAMYYYNKKILYEKRKEIIIKFLDNNTITIAKKINTDIINKEIKVIDCFGKNNKYDETKINIDNLDKIIYFDIDYDNLTIFLDIYTFVKKYELVNNINYNFNNKLLSDYYKHYYNIIAFISNLDDKNDIYISINYLIDDYINNVKILDNLIKDILINKKKTEWLEQKPNDCNHIIKYISCVFNNIIYDNLNEKFNNLNKN